NPPVCKGVIRGQIPSRRAKPPVYTGVVSRCRPLLILMLLTPLGAATAATARKTPAPRQSAFVRRWMKTLTLREKAAQLIFIPFHGAAPNSRSREYRQFMKLVRETRVGG